MERRLHTLCLWMQISNHQSRKVESTEMYRLNADATGGISSVQWIYLLEFGLTYMSGPRQELKNRNQPKYANKIKLKVQKTVTTG